MTSLDERRTAAEFAPVRVSGAGGRRPRLAAATWIVIVGGLLVGGVVGKILPGLAPGESVITGPAELRPAIDDAAVLPPRTGLPALVAEAEPVPVALDVSLAAGSVEVRGTIQLHAVALVSVALEDVTGRIRSSQTLSVDDPNGGVRPLRQMAFDVTFPVSRSAATGGWIEVGAFDGVGGPIGTVRTPFGTGVVKVPLKVNGIFVR